MKLGTAQVIRADARSLPLADNSVDLVVTSPPYFALRSYQDGGEHYEGQIGDEPTPAEFVASLLDVTRECVRVLKPSGSLWVNLGDKYAQDQERSRNGNGNRTHGENFTSGSVLRGPTVTLGRKSNGVPRKSLVGIPWRYALACIDDLGLILRAEVIWSKPNGLPESVTDRVRRSHEQWFHFVLEPRYFSAVDEIREQYQPSTMERNRYGRPVNGHPSGDHIGPLRSDRGVMDANPRGKLPGSVWTVPTEPLRVPDHLGVDHFAAFPTEWPKRIIQGWSPSGVCVECGEGRRPVVETMLAKTPAKWHGVLSGGQRARSAVGGGATGVGLGVPAVDQRRTIAGYVCACAANPRPNSSPLRRLPPTEPSVVLDPFGGTGTTAMVAKALGRHGISVDMSADYCRLAEWRTSDRDHLAKVLGVAKAEQQPEEQLDMFELLEEGA